ncbi:MAG: restriction endonuclease subunit S [Lachnospiraceae bacterium]|nr:restriction endonuclease subunit S [Lachnospiraceae bacterium]
MGNEKKHPEIRFDGFAESWEQRGLTDVLSPTVGNNTLSRADLNYDGGEVKNVHYGDVLIKFGSFVDALNDKIPFITNGTLADYKSNLLQDGDIIFADTAEDETTGKVAEITNAKEANIVSGLHTIVYRPKRKFADCFMGYYLNTHAYRYQLLPLMQGAKVLSLGRSHLATTFVRYPSSLDEQAIIADFFRNLDDTIALKKQQHEQTSNIKKAMLRKMFPKREADVPEIRFQGFYGTWEEKILGDIFINHPFRAYIAVPISNGKYMIIQQGDNPIIGYGDGNIFLEYADVVLFGDHTLSLYKPEKPFLIATDGVKILSGLDLSGQFLYVLLGRYMPKTQGYKRHFTIVKEETVMLPPTNEEKNAIGDYFRNLDILITAQCEELEKLQNIKKACLSKMFV